MFSAQREKGIFANCRRGPDKIGVSVIRLTATESLRLTPLSDVIGRARRRERCEMTRFRDAVGIKKRMLIRGPVAGNCYRARSLARSLARGPINNP